MGRGAWGWTRNAKARRLGETASDSPRARTRDSRSGPSALDVLEELDVGTGDHLATAANIRHVGPAVAELDVGTGDHPAVAGALRHVGPAVGLDLVQMERLAVLNRQLPVFDRLVRVYAAQVCALRFRRKRKLRKSVALFFVFF